MLSLSMVVIAALIGVGGLGQEVVRGMNTLDIGLGFEAGLAIVVMAVVLDRLATGFDRRGRRRKTRTEEDAEPRTPDPEAGLGRSRT